MTLLIANLVHRLSLADLYKSRKEQGEEKLKELTRKKKRIITKIVRRPLRRFHKKVEAAILNKETKDPVAIKTTSKPSKFSAFTERPSSAPSVVVPPVPPVVVSVKEVPADAVELLTPKAPLVVTTTEPTSESIRKDVRFLALDWHIIQ